MCLLVLTLSWEGWGRILSRWVQQWLMDRLGLLPPPEGLQGPSLTLTSVIVTEESCAKT